MEAEDTQKITSSSTDSALKTTPDPNNVADTSSNTQLDEEALFRRLSLSSHQALNRADEIQKALGQDKVHMEHLIAGLLQKQGGPTEELLGKAHVDLKTLSEIAETPFPPASSLSPSAPTALPPMSDHVRRALIAARDVADLYKSSSVRSRHLLYGALSITNCHVIQALLARGIRKEDIDLTETPSSSGHRIAGFDSDMPGGKDLLGIEKEVEALCAVLAAKDVEPPLSLGLFGDWGSGKSFFMRMMEMRIEELVKVAQHAKGKTAYCSNIVQLKFNAWHYIETDLWASLASEIIDGLARALVRKDDPDSQYAHARLLDNTARSKDELAKAKQEKAEADAILRESEQNLSKLEQDEEEIEAKLTPQALLEGTLRVAIQQPEVREAVQDAIKEKKDQLDAIMGGDGAKGSNYPTPDAMKNEVKNQLLELRGIQRQVRVLAIAIRNPKGRRTRLLLTFAVVFVIFVMMLVSALFGTYLIGVLGSLISLLAGVILALKPFVSGVKQALGLIEQTQQESQRIIREKVQQEREKLQQELTKAQDRVKLAQESLEKANVTAIGFEQQIENMQADRQLSNFIKQRHESKDYTRHLGVIARAREDFEKLSILLAKEREEAEKGVAAVQEKRLLPPIDRIILYIDDLDRCPESKVVDMLQAVHLLLAFPLFIVVVGVDSLWLLHSIKRHSQAFQNESDGVSEEERTHWQSTPLNYLEKIFQIPFTLRTMQESGFGRLIDSLSGQQNKAAFNEASSTQLAEISKEIQGNRVEDDKEQASHTENEPSNLPATLPEEGEQSSTPTLSLSTPPSEVTPSHVDIPPGTDIDANPGYLVIEEQQRAFMKHLFRFISSPRAAKRFVNVYRLLRASVSAHQLPAFIGDDNWGEYRAVLLLLAILVGYPTEATEIFRDLLEREHPETWWQFIDSFKERTAPPSPSAIDSVARNNGNGGETERWQELMEKLTTLRRLNLVPEIQPCAVFVDYAPQVARYSFQSGRVLIGQ